MKLAGITVIGLVSVSGCGSAYAQTVNRQPVFEVASIKPAAPPAGRGPGTLGRMLGGPGQPDPELFRCNNCNIPLLITRAYDIKSYQLTSPGWMETVRFDISARVPAGATKEQFNLMLQNLLAERFKLAIRRDRKEIQVYELVVGKGGIKFHESGDANARPFTSYRIGAIIGTRSKLDAFCSGLSVLLDRPVFNETNLAGFYDFELHFDPNTTQSGGVPGQQYDQPSIFTAFQEQMGLKLEPKTRQIDVVVVDRAEKVPTEN
jgi:uncharacterized protein (TIGR03435 family)